MIVHEERGLDGPDFARSIVREFDLDITHCGIYGNTYIKESGGWNVIELFMATRHARSDRQLRNLPQWIPLTAVKRARKYVSRLNYFHFSQYPMSLETISLHAYYDITKGEVHNL